MNALSYDIAAALQDGKTVIIDHVITSARIYCALNNAVAGFQMKTVLVSCDVEMLRRREAERGDRCAFCGQGAGEKPLSMVLRHPMRQGSGWNIAFWTKKNPPNWS